MRRPARSLAMIAAALAVVCSGCASADPENAEQPRHTVTVLAAASLTESFQDLADRFSREHPDVRVQFDFAGSATLVEQLRQGRSADVFAAADEKNMDEVVGFDGTDDRPQTFTSNRLTIAVPKGNPAHVTSLADVDRAESLVVCAPQVPCGTATEQAERAAGVDLRPVSEENDVKAVLRKVTAGEADAGLVYVTDARSAKDEVDAVDFPQADQARNDYPITVLRGAPEAEWAKRFVEFVRGPEGAEVLAKYGFGR